MSPNKYGTLAFFIAVLNITSGRYFRNPLLTDTDVTHNSVLFFNNTYYALKGTDDFSLYSSQNIQDWSFVANIFPKENQPSWADFTNPIYTLVEGEVYQLREDKFLLLFVARYNSSWVIGAAQSDNLFGDFQAGDSPVITGSNNLWSPALISYNSSLFLIWSDAFRIIKGQRFNENTLQLDDTDTSHNLMTYTGEWDEWEFRDPVFVERNGMFYMFYSGNGDCRKQAIGVARSATPVGRYEKLSNPILISNERFMYLGLGGVVKDLDALHDVLIYNAYKTGEVCGGLRLMCGQSLAWGGDGWPYIYD